MVRKTTVLLLAAIVMAAAGLTACASGTGDPADGTASSTVPASRVSTPPVPTEKPPSQPEMLAAITKIAVERKHMKVSGVAQLKARQDTKGTWWAAGTAIPVQTERYEPLRVVIVYRGGVWKLFKIGETIDPEDLPADVRTIL